MRPIRNALLLATLVVSSAASHSRAENLYLLASATGGETGGDWHNAWSRPSEIKWGAGPGKLGNGDTLWIAGGTYGVIDLNYDGGTGSRVIIRRADAAQSACVSALGWVASFDTQVIVELRGYSTKTDYDINLRGTWFVRPVASGVKNGVSWSNAFSPNTIRWDWIGPGDTVWLGGGTYGGALTIGASGTLSNRIFVRAAQDVGFNTPAVFNGGLYCSRDYVTVDGNFNGQRHIKVIGSVAASEAKDIQLFNLEISTGSVGISSIYGSGGEIARCWIYDIRGEAAIRLSGKNQSTSQYDLTKIYDNVIQVNSVVATGLGPDGIQACNGLSFYSNHIYGVAGLVIGEEHQDLIQGQGTTHHKIYANLFENTADAMIGVDTLGSATAGYAQIFNNVFRNTTGSGTVAIRYYNSYLPGTLSQFRDLLIDNNTFVDLSLATNYGLAVRLDAGSSANATAQNTHLRNNLFFNCGGANPVMAIMGSTPNAGWSIDYNLLHAGAQGSADIQFVGIGNYSQAHGQALAPTFLSYTPGATNNNLRLGVLDLAAKNKGISLHYFNVDQEGVIRPQGTAWDIGAFEAAP